MAKTEVNIKQVNPNATQRIGMIINTTNSSISKMNISRYATKILAT